MFLARRLRPLITALAVFALISVSPVAEAEEPTYTQDEILEKARDFFGPETEGLEQTIQRTFADHGRPNAYIAGEEFSAAIGIGARYGEGELNLKSGLSTTIYWQGPSIGLDFGGTSSKVLTLVYNLPNPEAIYQRFPSVEGTLYIIGGVGVSYLESEEMVLAPIRTGVGLRAGANFGYLHFDREKTWNPF